MKHSLINKLVCHFLFVMMVMLSSFSVAAFAGENTATVHPSLENLSFSVLAYLDYSYGQLALADDEQEDYNAFRNTRGYLTAVKGLTDWMSMRLTLDVTQDETGDYKVRHKYLYVELKTPGAGFFTNIKSEIGMGHIPWLDFEEHINPYRCQGTMAIERAGTFNSADLGIGVMGGFGGKLDNAKERTGNSSYDGRFGSWHLGIYNGSGYHAAEKNENKVIQGRVTVRPLPAALPGLQFSAFGIYGKANIAEDPDNDVTAPDYRVSLGMVSYEHPRFTMTAHYFQTEGNAKGSWIDDNGDALTTEGFSLFARVKLPVLDNKLALWGRFDHFDADMDNAIAEKTAYDMIIGSITYDMYKGNLLMLVFEQTTFETDNGGKGKSPAPGKNLGDESKAQVVWQIKF